MRSMTGSLGASSWRSGARRIRAALERGGSRVASPSAFRLDGEVRLRGTRATRVLASRGHLLQNSAGDAATFDLSEDVGSLHTFISHNWSTTRYDKFLVLALHFNYSAMMMSNLVSAMIIFVLTVWGVLPNSAVADSDGIPQPRMTWCVPLSLVSSLVVLFTWHIVLDLLGLDRRMIFLDKTCIHQTDEQLKRKGIQCLAAYILNSRNMLAVYSHIYLKKLWTVYELTTFLLVHPSKYLAVVPLLPAKLLLVGSCVLSLWTMVYVAVRTFWKPNTHYQFAAVDVAFGLFIAYLFRMWNKSRRQVVTDARGFSLRSAACAVEADRLQVQHNVTTLMKMLHLVEPDATMDAAVDHFDAVVREGLPTVVKANLGHCWSYQHCVTTCMCFALAAVDRLAVQCTEDMPAFDMCMWFVSGVCETLFIIPIFSAGVGWVCSWFMELSLLAELCWMLFVSVLINVVYSFWAWYHRKLTLEALESTRGLLVNVGYLFVMVLAVVVLFGFQRRGSRSLAGPAELDYSLERIGNEAQSEAPTPQSREQKVSLRQDVEEEVPEERVWLPLALANASHVAKVESEGREEQAQVHDSVPAPLPCKELRTRVSL